MTSHERCCRNGQLHLYDYMQVRIIGTVRPETGKYE